jgi:hypothetical protein
MSEPEQQQTLSYETPPTAVTGLALGTIGLQLVGLYCFINALPVLAMMASFMGVGGRAVAGSVLAAFIPFAAYAAMGVLLIRFAPRISVWLFRDNASGVMAGPVTPGAGQYIQAIAFAVAGAILVVTTLPNIVSLIWYAFSDMGAAFPASSMLIEPVMRFLAGLALFLQSKGLAQLWHKIRAGAVVDSPPPPPTTERVAPDSERA